MTAEAARGAPVRWERVESHEKLQGDGPHPIAAAGVDLVLIRTPDGPRVYEGRCPHQGALLGEGEIEGGALVCRNHRWRFALDSGQRIGGRQCLRACPVREEAGELLVDVGAIERGPAPPAAVKEARRRISDLPGPRGLPILGNLLQLEPERIHLVLEGWARQYGSLYTIRFGRKRALVVSDVRLTEPMLRDRPQTFRRPSPMARIFGELGLRGVFSAEGEEWRWQRRLAMEALSQRHLRGFYPALKTVAERFLRRFERAADTGREIDLAAEFKLFTVDVTMLLVFGHDVNTLEQEGGDVIQNQLEHIFPLVNRRLIALLPYWRYFQLPSDRRFARALHKVRDWLEARISESRARLASDPQRAEHPVNFIEAMICARDETGEPFGSDVLLGNALTMLLAGEDTTAYTLAWAVHHLCDAPKAAAALQRECDDTLFAERVPADLEQAGSLRYASAVANEAMRLRPVAPMIFLESNHDTAVGDIDFPRGTLAVLLTRPSAVDGAHFAAPQSFRPERWIEGDKPHDPSAHIPFGSGPRICPGRSLALLEMRIVLATLYRSFTVERVGSSQDVSELSSFTMMPQGLRVRLRRRS